MSHPLPTRLTFLSRLHHFSPGEKVRFLGCVTKYSTKTATLTLQHDRLHPDTNTTNTTTTKKALIDTNLLLSTLSATDTQIGEWVHVIGYVTTNEHQNPNAANDLEVCVQALVLWSAKAVKLDEYERVVEERLSVG